MEIKYSNFQTICRICISNEDLSLIQNSESQNMDIIRILTDFIALEVLIFPNKKYQYSQDFCRIY